VTLGLAGLGLDKNKKKTNRKNSFYARLQIKTRRETQNT
jgi:hypothetical protein